MTTRRRYHDTKSVPTGEYDSLAFAFDFYNNELWDGRLPLVMITLHRHPRAYGYYSPDRFGERVGDGKVSEIALNPAQFAGRSDAEILSTLVHEMAHLWQFSFGNPSRRGYHNHEWANEMKRIGLMPSDTGAEGGRRVGQAVSHWIVPGGDFDVLTRRLLGIGFHLTWQSVEPMISGTPKPGGTTKTNTRAKYTCPVCKLNAWAKPGANLVCGDCEERMEAQE
jgi:hypothetical protein